MQSRWKSKMAWVSVSALIFFIFKTYGILEVIGLTQESYKELTTLIFSVLMAFGVFHNPTNTGKF